MTRMIRIRKRRLLKKFFLFFTFSTPFSSVMQFDACFLSVRKTVIVYRILIILSQKNGLFYILAKSNLFFAAINAQDISQEILPWTKDTQNTICIDFIFWFSFQVNYNQNFNWPAIVLLLYEVNPEHVYCWLQLLFYYIRSSLITFIVDLNRSFIIYGHH